MRGGCTSKLVRGRTHEQAPPMLLGATGLARSRGDAVTDAITPTPAIMTPTFGIDGRVALATSLHAAPGIYAVLVGSGMSSAAGIPTGWQVVQDLVRKIALAEGIDPDELGDEPGVWWVKQGRPKPHYDTLLAALASTDAGRQALLHDYFETGLGGAGQAQPTDAHRALAALVAHGRVRVIITTNFDHLIERALDQAGVAAQVLSHAGAIAGMTPLPHARATVVKVHGDYLSLGMRNTADELASYPERLNVLLARVWDEYGLVVVGWSAEYDTALVKTLESAPSRRYPTYWATFRGSVSEPARRLIAERQAYVLHTTGADDFLGDLVQRVDRLDHIARRRGRPTILRHYLHMPNASSPLPGWSVQPLLQLRAAGVVSPATQETCGFLRAEQREAVLETLRSSRLTARLRHMASCPGAEPVSAQTITAVSDWHPTPGGHQSNDSCSYRLGEDSTSGVSAIVAVRLPGFGVNGQVEVMVDVSLSLREKVPLADAALILRDGLVLVTASIPEVLYDILPPESTSTLGEIHFVAATRIPTMIANQGTPQNDVSQRVDLTSLGTPTRSIGGSMGAAAQLSGPLADRGAAEVVCDALDYMVHANGFLDPRAGLALVREELEVAIP
jgi:hypothetical protein